MIARAIRYYNILTLSFIFLILTSVQQTGTLTEDGLDMWGVAACTNGVLAEAETDISKLKDHPLFEGMLVCHSLTFINGKLYGDPLDAKVKYLDPFPLLLFHCDRIIDRCDDICVIDVRKYQVDIERFGLHVCK